MQCVKNSVTVEELMDDGAPYKLWDADRYACPECGAEVITGFAAVPFAEHWQPDYVTVRARYAPVWPGRWRAES
jgi:hypothetical protein